jgi:hypothetical protein
MMNQILQPFVGQIEYEASINQLCHWEGRLPRHPAAIDRILAHPFCACTNRKGR